MTGKVDHADLVERLRRMASSLYVSNPLETLRQAADRIQQLEASPKLERLLHFECKAEAMADEIEALRKERDAALAIIEAASKAFNLVQGQYPYIPHEHAPFGAEFGKLLAEWRNKSPRTSNDT